MHPHLGKEFVRDLRSCSIDRRAVARRRRRRRRGEALSHERGLAASLAPVIHPIEGRNLFSRPKNTVKRARMTQGATHCRQKEERKKKKQNGSSFFNLCPMTTPNLDPNTHTLLLQGAQSWREGEGKDRAGRDGDFNATKTKSRWPGGRVEQKKEGRNERREKRSAFRL